MVRSLKTLNGSLSLVYRSLILYMLSIAILFVGQSALAEGCNGRSGLLMSTQDNYVFLSGNICMGDGKRFVQFMDTAGKGYKIVRLNLTGGVGADAVQMGRYLRKHGLTTWTDGRQDVCSSACNRVFSGGLQRIYSHANYIQTGKNPKQKFGLGYHHPNSGGNFQAAEDWYQTGIVPYLKEMLPTQAFNWVYKTDEANLTYEMVWLSGRQALELGISTSDKAP
jgi:hypothetical protein